MLILSIDTCGSNGTVALARLSGNNLEIFGQSGLAGKTYSAQLVPSVRNLLAAHSVNLSVLNAIVVTGGPGSFTGIRIGLSTAKGLAEGHDTPLLAVSRLAVLAHRGLPPHQEVRAAALDASRREFYFGDYSDSSINEALITPDHFRQLSATFGQSLAVCEESARALAPNATFVPPPTAADALSFALPRLRARDFNDPLTLDGNYLRRSDAEIFAVSAIAPPPESNQTGRP
jgi:tRNA threonylcarbamoyladenosine biosynthesis protein TsaB